MTKKCKTPFVLCLPGHNFLYQRDRIYVLIKNCILTHWTFKKITFNFYAFLVSFEDESSTPIPIKRCEISSAKKFLGVEIFRATVFQTLAFMHISLRSLDFRGACITGESFLSWTHPVIPSPMIALEHSL